MYDLKIVRKCLNGVFMIKKKLKAIPVGLRASIVYIIASVFSKGLVMITMPIFTRIMTTGEIGAVNLYSSWNSMLTVVITLSLTSGGFHTALKDFPEERDQYTSSVLSLTTITALFFGAVYFIAPNLWNHFTGLSTNMMLLMLVGFIFLPAKEFWLLRQRYEFQYKLVGGMTIIVAVVSTIAAVMVVLSMNELGASKIAEGRLIATNAVPILVSAAIWVNTFRKGKQFYNKKFWKYSLAISLPLLVYSFAGQVLNVSDRIMIGKMVSDSAVGIYGTIYNVSTIPMIVWQAINASFVPYLYQNIDRADNKIKSISLSLLSAYSMIAVMITFLAPEIVRIIATEEYYDAIYIVPPIAAGIYLTSVSNMYSSILVFRKKANYVMYAAVIAAMTNVGLNYVCIQMFGYMAAAYTTLFAYAILAFVQMHYVYRAQGKLGTIYHDHLILLLSLATIGCTLLGIILYRYVGIRYMVVVAGLATGMNIAIKTLKTMKSKKEF